MFSPPPSAPISRADFRWLEATNPHTSPPVEVTDSSWSRDAEECMTEVGSNTESSSSMTMADTDERYDADVEMSSDGPDELDADMDDMSLPSLMSDDGSSSSSPSSSDDDEDDDDMLPHLAVHAPHLSEPHLAHHASSLAAPENTDTDAAADDNNNNNDQPTADLPGRQELTALAIRAASRARARRRPLRRASPLPPSLASPARPAPSTAPRPLRTAYASSPALVCEATRPGDQERWPALYRFVDRDAQAESMVEICCERECPDGAFSLLAVPSCRRCRRCRRSWVRDCLEWGLREGWRGFE